MKLLLRSLWSDVERVSMEQIYQRFLSMCLLLVLTSLMGSAHAESRALIIGVGDYRDEKVNDLPGLDIDVNIMKRVASSLGYKKSAVRVLQDSDATLENIKLSFTDWLSTGVNPDDQVLIYFSGHGAQFRDLNGDESDGLDEFFLTHDFKASGGDIQGALFDDVFYELLTQIPTDNVLLIVDACHSGTGFKSFNGALTGVSGGVVKYHSVENSDNMVDSGFAMGEKNYDDRFVAMMASGDDESAIATTRGSVFTLGIEQAIRQGLSRGSLMTPVAMIDDIREFVKKELAPNPNIIFTPQIGGASDLINKPLQLVVTPSFRNRLLTVIEGVTPLVIASNKARYSLEDKSMRISVDVPEAGYLNIINVNSQDSTVVLFPNLYNPDNRVAPGQVAIPTQQMQFDLVAREPTGESLFVAIWTPYELNMYNEGKGNRNELQGDMPDVFHELSEFSATRNFSAEARLRDGWRAGSIIVNVVP